MTIRILTEEQVRATIEMKPIVAAIEGLFRAKPAGTLTALPRHHVRFPDGSITLTIGGIAGDTGLAGFRAAGGFKNPDAQFTAVWNTRTGLIEGIVQGATLGAYRTGAIGGVAVKFMAAPDASGVAVIGAGNQARTQLLAAAAVRDLTAIRVHSRSRESANRFAAEMGAKLGIPVTPFANPDEAVAGADIVLCATTSPETLLQASWIKPGAHVSTVGPKFRERHEIDIDFAERAVLIATDSPEQLAAYEAPFILAGSPLLDRVVDLALLVSGEVAVPLRGDGITLFYSVGTGGTEVVAAATLLRATQQE